MRTYEEVIELIKANIQPHEWLREARENHKELNALVNGIGFKDLLIEKIEKIENLDRAVARKKYSRDIRDLFERVMEPRSNVFSADGGSEEWAINDSKRKDKLVDVLTKFKSGKSLDNYLQNHFFKLSDIDPNGLIFLEYKSENGDLKKVYPTYKSINDIRNYEPDGLKVEWVLFEPKKVYLPNKSIIYLWRYVDESNDFTIIQSNTQSSDTFQLSEERSFKNEFGEVPACILSPIEKVGSKLRLSYLFYIQELSKEYARDISIKTIYKFLQGFPKHWRYVQICNTCRGTGKQDGKKCISCDGRGQLGKNDVTDDIRLPLPKHSDDATVAPNVGGFISPDLDTLKYMDENNLGLEELIEYTMWGTYKVNKAGRNETATGRFLDLQPLNNKLNLLASNVQDVHNLLASFAIRLADSLKEVDVKIYQRVYGRRFIIESPDVLMEKYSKARKDGAPITVLDKILGEIINSKYKNDPSMRDLMQKKSRVEPYVHLTIKEVSDIFGKVEANKKVLFDDFWRQSYKTKPVEELKSDFDNWFEQNNKIVENNKTNTNGE